MAATGNPTLADAVAARAQQPVIDPTASALGNTLRNWVAPSVADYYGSRQGEPGGMVPQGPTIASSAAPYYALRQGETLPATSPAQVGTLPAFNRTFQDPHVAMGTAQGPHDAPMAQMVTDATGIPHAGAPAGTATRSGPPTVNEFIASARAAKMTPYQANMLLGLAPVVPAQEQNARMLNAHLQDLYASELANSKTQADMDKATERDITRRTTFGKPSLFNPDTPMGGGMIQPGG